MQQPDPKPYDDSELAAFKSHPFLTENPVVMFWRFMARVDEDRRKLARAVKALRFIREAPDTHFRREAIEALEEITPTTNGEG